MQFDGKQFLARSRAIVPLRRSSLLLSFLLFLALGARAQRPELLYLRLNEDSGTSTADLAIPGVPGTSVTMVSGVVWESGSQVLGASSLLLNVVPGTAGQDIAYTNSTFNHSGDWTIEFRGKRTLFALAQQRAALGKNGATSITINHFQTFYPLAVTDTLTLEGPGVNSVTVEFPRLWPDWQHFAFVHDSNARTITAYVNGSRRAFVWQTNSIPLNGDGIRGMLFGGTVQNDWDGAIDELRIWSRALSGQEIVAGMNVEIDTVSVDVGVVEIMTPSRTLSTMSSMPYGTAETVSIRVSNLGAITLPTGTAIPLSFTVEGGPTVANETLILTAALSTGASVPFTFATTADLSGADLKSITVSSAFNGDSQPINDSKSRQLTFYLGGEVDRFPYAEDFGLATEPNGPPLGWTHGIPSPGTDWIFTSNPNKHDSNLSLGDHTSGLVGAGMSAMVPTSFTHNAIVLKTPTFDFTNVVNPRLEFWYSSRVFSLPFSSTIGPANILRLDLVLQPSGTTIWDIVGPIGDPYDYSTDWHYFGVDLSAYSGQRLLLRFRVDGSINTTEHSILMDDFQATDHVLGIGQPPQPGLAVMDLNGALSPGGLDVSFLENGPYSASASPGGPLNFAFEGDSNQPIIVLFGNLNVQAATFGNIGQMDIGGIADPMTGIPAGIATLFNGTNPLGLNPLFVTSSSGDALLQLTMSALPPGILTTFQAAITNDSFGISLSNCIQLEVK